MSTKDISRFLLQPKKHYRGMRMQQGRVLLDSDYNEGANANDEDERRTLADLIGPQGSPDSGFAIGDFRGSDSKATPVQPEDELDITEMSFNNVGVAFVPNYYILPGTMYVGGLRFQLDELASATQDLPDHIAFQRDFLQASFNDVPEASDGTFAHFFYLNGWEQTVSAVEDQEILETALGGPDTSVRVRRMRRVQFATANSGETCATALARVLADQFGSTASFQPDGELKSEALLRIGFLPGVSQDTCSPCSSDAIGRYLGAENQAIRIMLTDSSHYVWAFDNSAPLHRVSISNVSDNPIADVVVTMKTLPKDEEHWPLHGRVVEIIPWAAILENGEKVADEVGVFCRVDKSYDPDAHTFTLDRSVVDSMTKLNNLIHIWPDHPEPLRTQLNQAEAADGQRQFFVRFWHQSDDQTTPVEIPTQDNDFAPALGNTGLVPHFIAPGRRGDFWVAAVRPETPQRVLPLELQDPVGTSPHGPRHFYAPLAIVTGTAISEGSGLKVSTVEDCRRHMAPVTDIGCCTIIVGDGVHSIGQYTRIQSAIDALPPEGGRVCIRPGTYAQEFQVTNRNNVEIEGCGERTVITSPPSPQESHVIKVDSGPRVVIRSLRIEARNQGAVRSRQCDQLLLEDLHVVEVPMTDGTVVAPALVDANTFGVPGPVMRSLQIDVVQQQAIVVQSESSVQLEDITVTAQQFSEVAAPVAPLVDISTVGLALFRRGRLNGLGRVGLLVQAPQGGRFESIVIQQGDYFSNASRYGIEVINSANVQILDCEIAHGGALSDYSSILISSGSDVLLAGNRVLTTVGSDNQGPWGGICLGSGGPYELRNNLIQGGTGHGITLGAVLWQAEGGEGGEGGGATHSEPPGKAQLRPDGTINGDLKDGFVDSSGVQFGAVPDAPLKDVVIKGNVIQGMKGNGISALTVLGLPDDADLLTVDGLTIDDNRIHDNLKGPFFPQIRLVDDAAPVGGSANGVQNGSGLELPVIPFGGIVLSVVLRRALIRNNVIESNAFVGSPPTTQHAIAGIFLLLGEGIVISGNHLAKNGDIPDASTTTTVRSGLRAGIGIVHATTGLSSGVSIAEAIAEVGNVANDCALRVANNVVRQPEGRALFAVAAGSVSVTANFFSSQGFHGASSPPDTVALGDVVFIQNLGKPWEALTDPGPPTLSNKPGSTDFRQPSWAHAYITGNFGEHFKSPPNTLFFAGQGGHTLFNDNHVVYDWRVERFPPNVPLSYFSVAILSLDHVGLQNNQVAFRMNRTVPTSLPLIISPPSAPFGPEFLLSNVFAMGATVQVTGNRVSEALEELESSFLSILTYSLLMNTTALNQTSRCVAVFNREFSAHTAGPPGTSLPQGDDRWVIDSQNLYMISERSSFDAPAGNPVHPCDAFYHGDTGIWELLMEFTRLFVDKRV